MSSSAHLTHQYLDITDQKRDINSTTLRTLLFDAVTLLFPYPLTLPLLKTRALIKLRRDGVGSRVALCPRKESRLEITN